MTDVQRSTPTTKDAAPSGKKQNVLHWVKPASPTRLDGCRSMPLPGMDQIFFPIDCVFVYPGRIDPERFKVAVSKTLAAWPHLAGRLLKTREGTWKILLNKSPVPVTFAESDITISEDSLRAGMSELCDPMSWTYAPPPDAPSQPLIRWKVTWLPKTQDTAIVFHFCHVLGDGGVVAQMQHTLSDYYRGIEPQGPLPSYEKYFELPPRLPEARFEEILHQHIPNLVNGYDPETLMGMGEKLHGVTETVDLTFSAEQLRLLQRVAIEQARGLGGQQDVRISRGDAFIAYIVTLFNRNYPHTFNQLMNVVHTRGRKFPPDALYQLHSISAAGNALFHSVSEPFPDAHLFHLGAIALSVRNTIAKVDNYEFLRDCMSVCEQRYDEMSAKGQLPWMFPGERAIGANLLHKVPFQVAHFGFGHNRVRFYTYPADVHHVRAFPSNPEKLPDGTWRDNVDGIHAFFRVQKGMAEKFYETVKRDIERGFADGLVGGDGKVVARL